MTKAKAAFRTPRVADSDLGAASDLNDGSSVVVIGPLQVGAVVLDRDDVGAGLEGVGAGADLTVAGALVGDVADVEEVALRATTAVVSD